MYWENMVEIPQKIAGLLLSAILSDTLMFRSPTSTPIDERVAHELAKIAGVDIEDYASQMFEAGSNIEGKTAQDKMCIRDRRYAVPFLTAQQPLMEDQAVLSQQDWDYYHVRLSDLEAVCSGYWNELEWDYSLQSRRRMRISVRELCSLQLLSTDTVLYQSGIYQSPDLSVPLWDNTDTLLVSAGVAMIVLFAVHPKRTLSNRKVY